MACYGHFGFFASVGSFASVGPFGHAAPVIIKHDWAPLYHPSAGESPR